METLSIKHLQCYDILLGSSRETSILILPSWNDCTISGRYAEALQNYYEALQVEEDPMNRSYTFYNNRFWYIVQVKYTQALEFYHQALSLN
jgi:tetratricopeptide (TPR) repeat protein